MSEDKPKAMAICYAIYQKLFSEYRACPTRDSAPLCFRDLAIESSIQRLFSYLSRHELSSLPLSLDAQNNACVQTRKFNIALVLNLCREIISEHLNTFELNLSGIITSKKSPGPFAHVTWIEETIQEKDFLMGLQSALISRLSTLCLPFSNALGEKYSPHVTYAATLEPVDPEVLAALAPAEPRDLSIRCTLRLGVSDSYWQTSPVSRALTASLDWTGDPSLLKENTAVTSHTPQ